MNLHHALKELRGSFGTQESPIALDEVSVRSYGVDGFLHVATTNISKAAVNPYKGSEIPFYEQLGLDANKIYQLFRDPKELEKAAPTFNNLKLLSKHVPINAVDDHPELTIGSTGTDATFDEPYLKNSLVIWQQGAIDNVNSNKKKELSSAYRYRADMTPGTYEGQKYDGVMRDLVGNHVALVEDGRAGADVVVGDSRENLDTKRAGVVAGEKKEKPMTKKISRQAAITVGVLGSWLRPKLAQDAKIDLGPLVEGLTAKNYAQQKPTLLRNLRKSLKGKLAQDASIGELAELLDLIDSHDVAEDEPEIEAAKVPGEELVRDRAKDDMEDIEELDEEKGEDADPTNEVEAFLKDKLSGADLQHVCNIMRGSAEDVGEQHPAGEEKLEELGAAMDDPEAPEERRDNAKAKEWHEGEGEKPPAADRKRAMDRGKRANDKKAKDRKAMDEPPPFKGMPKVGGKMEKGMDKHAMDAALKSVAEQTEKRILGIQRDIRKAEREVRPWVGDLAMDEATCASDIYGAALSALDIDTDGIHPSAWPTILKMQPLPGAAKNTGGAKPRVAMDAKATQSFNEMFPDVSRIGLM